MTDALDEIRERRAVVVAADLNADALNGVYAAMVRLAREDSARLLAAVEAVLKLADEACELEVKGVRLDWWDLSPSRLREAITRALSRL